MIAELKDWFGLIAVIITVAGFFYGQLTSAGSKALKEVGDLGKAMDARFDEVEKDARKFGEAMVARFQMQEQKIAVLNEAIEHVPDREQSHRLELAIEKLTGRMETLDQRMTGRIETLDERLKPVSAISDRLQEFLLEQARSGK